jgi:hypothetical protein
MVSKYWSGFIYLLLELVGEPNALENCTVECNLLLKDGGGALPKCVGATCALASNRMDVGDPCSGCFFLDMRADPCPCLVPGVGALA